MRTMETGPVAVEQRRQALRWTLGALVAGLLVACGGGGGGESDDSQDLRAAIDRLQPGMNTDEVIAAVGWPPNDGPTYWMNSTGYLQVSMNSIDGGEPQITSAIYDGSERVQRGYI